MTHLVNTRGYEADRETSAGELVISLLGHCEERETQPGDWTVIPIRPLLPFRRPVGAVFRIATPAREIRFAL